MSKEQEIAQAYSGRQKDGGYYAMSRGICGFCHEEVQVGDKFWWNGSAPPAVECEGCREFRLGRKRKRGK